MCGEHQALTLGSGCHNFDFHGASFCQVTLILSLSPPAVCLFILSYRSLSLKPLDLSAIKATVCQCRFPDSNTCSDDSNRAFPVACETPASVYFHLQRQQTLRKVPDANINTANMFSHGTSRIPWGPRQITKVRTFLQSKHFHRRNSHS